MPDSVFFRLIIWHKLKNLKLKCHFDIHSFAALPLSHIKLEHKKLNAFDMVQLYS